MFIIITINVILVDVLKEKNIKKIDNDLNSKMSNKIIEDIKTEKILKNEDEEQNDVENMLEDVMDSIVGISRIKQQGTSIFLNNATEELGLGTGMIVSDKGYILTNEHVAGKKYGTCYITLATGEKLEGTVKWSDTDLDLAIVKINTNSELKSIKLGESNKVRVGKSVFAIGNPVGFEFQRTVTAGIISAVNRTIMIEEENRKTYMEDLIQTDATINPGNSGGPLITEEGNMIGINTIKITSAEGIGFAVPIDIVKPIIKKFEERGEFEEPALGLFAYDKEVIPYLDSNIIIDKGIYIVDIKKKSNAEKVGIKVGDIITKIDDIEINKMMDLRSYIYEKEIGDKVILKVNRNNIELELPIELVKK